MKHRERKSIKLKKSSIGPGCPRKIVDRCPYLCLLTAGLLLFSVGCSKKAEDAPTSVVVGPALVREALPLVKVPGVKFREVTDQSGIRFRHVNGAFGKKLLPETMGSGVAFLDYDNDGRQDLLLVNSCYWPGFEDKSKTPPTLALYRNRGDGTFEDVTEQAGLAVTMYGMGVTAGDYDNDGFIDVFITGVGGNRLFHNVPDGKGGRRFVDVTRTAGVGGPGGWTAAGNFLSQKTPLNFSSSACFVDYDQDGLLDLFVCNYVSWSPDSDLRQAFTLEGRDRAYGPPIAFAGANCFLYRNLGNGHFEDVSSRAGIQVTGTLDRAVGKSLGIIACDVDEDGWPDLVVANDTVRNFFFHNKGDGTFEEIGERAGVAYAEGNARGAMGIDWGEYRAGQNALVIGNFANEPDTFLHLDEPRQLLFSDAALAEGIAGPSRTRLKFGVMFLDYDLDGRLDLLSCNGHLEPAISQVQTGQTYRQPVQLFWNTGGPCAYEPVTAAQAGADLFKPMVGRGCAYADINGDGYPDLVLTENGGSARLLINQGGTGHHWIRLVLEGDGKTCNRSAIGARVVLKAGGFVQKRQVLSARGYLSQSELPVTFGLGKETSAAEVTIFWAARNAAPQILRDLKADRVYYVRQGQEPRIQ
jgi:hypothetical protein